MSDSSATEPKNETPEGSAEAGGSLRAGDLPDPADTDHPTGEKQAAENADNEPAG